MKTLKASVNSIQTHKHLISVFYFSTKMNKNENENYKLLNVMIPIRRKNFVMIHTTKQENKRKKIKLNKKNCTKKIYFPLWMMEIEKAY